MLIGCHLSISESKGINNLPKIAEEIGATTFQFFTRNPRGVNRKQLDPNKIESLARYKTPIIAHAPYTLNPCSVKEDIRELAYRIMDEDLQLLENTTNCMYNFHPGNHTGQGTEIGIKQTSDLINRIQKKRTKNLILIETMSGKGTEIGKTFEEIKQIINKIERKDLVGVCLDTCHVWDAGYNVKDDISKVLEEFNNIIGINYLKAVHLNDSKNPKASHKDRHEKLGLGFIGWEGIQKIVTSPLMKNLPFCLETPNDLIGYEKEIIEVKKLQI